MLTCREVSHTFKYFNGGSYSQVYDLGDYVLKVPKQQTDDNDKQRVAMRRAISVQTVRMFQTMRKEFGKIIPETWYVHGGFVLQTKAYGHSYASFSASMQQKAWDNAYALVEKSREIWEGVGWHFDTNTLNFFFNEKGKVTSWVDPFTTNNALVKKLLQKNVYREEYY